VPAGNSSQTEVPQSSPLFSIIIPTYCTAGVLEECLKALSAQSVKSDFEVLVVNDGGKDSISLEALDPQISVRYIRQDHKGPAAARNLGVRLAKGDIVIFLDDDSVPTKTWLEATRSAWGKTPDCDGIGGFIASDPSENIYCRVNADFFNWYLEQQDLEGKCPFLVTCNAGYRRSSLEKVGGFDDRFQRACGEDRDLNLKIVRGGGKLRLDRQILVYHDRDLTLSSFARKHYHYGKAAARIYQRYPDQKHISGGGYGALFLSIWRRHADQGDRLRALSLITLSQIATVFGFLAGKLHNPREISDEE
jgi:glycosyltransferase involved in cell wall biosynthesis